MNAPLVIPTVREGSGGVGGTMHNLRAAPSPRSLPHGRDDNAVLVLCHWKRGDVARDAPESHDKPLIPPSVTFSRAGPQLRAARWGGEVCLGLVSLEAG